MFGYNIVVKIKGRIPVESHLTRSLSDRQDAESWKQVYKC